MRFARIYRDGRDLGITSIYLQGIDSAEITTPSTPDALR